MSYLQKLEEWYQAERTAGRVLDIKFAPVDAETTVEQHAKAVYETVTGQRETKLLDTSEL